MAGSIAPDIGEFVLWRALGYIPSYDGNLSKMFEELEQEKPEVFRLYKLAHSIWTPLLFTALWLWWSPTDESYHAAWCVGLWAHVVTDFEMHRKSWPLYPIPLLVRATNANWWDWDEYKTRILILKPNHSSWQGWIPNVMTCGPGEIIAPRYQERLLIQLPPAVLTCASTTAAFGVAYLYMRIIY